MAVDADGWTILDHVCRRCWGRMLQKENKLRCSSCGTTGTASNLRYVVPSYTLCFCGVAAATTGTKTGPTRKEFFRCVPATEPRSPAASEINVFYGDAKVIVT